ncbi:MAG: helix-turn-helix domain-containing protein [Sutterellaceae bacterium]|nr:helix-turn-helix domain-containing protein [Sutterellaceae bacterium]
MDRNMIVDAYAPDCPIRNVLARLSDKWSLLLLYWLNQKDVMRFGDLRRAVPDISQKMLTVTLRTLEVDGFVTRKVYPEIPPKVEYALTDRARSFIPHMEALIGWAVENMTEIVADRRKNLSTDS